MRRGLPDLLVLLAPVALFPGVLVGQRISAGDHLSVQDAWQTEVGTGAVRHPLLSDPALQLDALHERVAMELAAGHLPTWNPDIYGGVPLLADGQSMALHPLSLLHVLLPTDLAASIGALLILGLAALGGLRLGRALGLGTPAAWACGLATMVGPYMGVWLLHPHAAAAATLPWMLLGVERIRRGRSGVVLAVAAALSLLAGHPETAAHVLVIAGIWGLARAPSIRTLVALAAGVALAAPVWLPMWLNLRASATIAAHGQGQLLLAQLLDLVWPSWWGHPAREDFKGAGVWADGVLNPGIGALVFAALGCRHKLGRWFVLGWALCIIAAVTGLPGPLNDSRLGGIGALLLGPAVGFGVRGLGRLAPLGAVVVLAAGLHARWFDQATLPVALSDPEPAPWVGELQELAGDGRVLGIDEALIPNTGSRVGLRDLRGYDLPLSYDTERLMQLLDRRMERPWFPVSSVNAQNKGLLLFAGVRYIVAPEPQFGLDRVEVGAAPVFVYALDAEAPRAWVTPAARGVSDPRQAADYVVAGYATRDVPAVEGLLQRWPTEGTLRPVEVEERGAAEVRVQLPERSEQEVLILADRWDAGWEVKVDGEARELRRAGGFFRAVVVQPEDQEVVFRYRAPGLPEGFALAGLGLLVLGGLGVRRWR